MKKIYLLIASLLIAVGIQAQTVKGTVYALSSGDLKTALPYATVYWAGTEKAVATDDKGHFAITLPAGKQLPLTLAASFLGYTTDSLRVNSAQQEVVFELREGAALDEVTIQGHDAGNYVSKLTAMKTEIISTAGLQKMACCNLAESFENSASISVGYSDAVTGARQIRLLGLSGIYTQMLDESRPIMRGLSAPFGLSYVPGQWLESIQVAKGAGSVVHGYEAITGQINLEHRKPITPQPFFANLYVDEKLRTELNLASSLQLNNKWFTTILAHGSLDLREHDGNHDGFLDEPLMKQINLANRWIYMGDNGGQLRFGVRGLYETREGGQAHSGSTHAHDTLVYASNIENKQFNAYIKYGVPLIKSAAEVVPNIAFVLDYTFHELNSFYGLKNYNGRQNSAYANILLQSGFGKAHRYIVGIGGRFDDFDERLDDVWFNQYGVQRSQTWYTGRREWVGGLFGEYTLNVDDKLTAIAGLRADYNSLYRWLITPRLNVKYTFTGDIVFRASAGRGFRAANTVADNIGMLATGREIYIEDDLKIEDAWTYGASFVFYFKLFREEKSSLSVEYFRTDFINQVVADQERDQSRVWLYNLDGKSYNNTYQIDFNTEPLERFSVFATFRYTEANTTLKDINGNHLFVERPLVDEYKGVLNLQYATRMHIWTFDATAQLNGRSRLPNFMPDEYSPVYPLFFAQITRKFKGVEVYAGCENILNYKQENPILSASAPYSPDFNASVIWGPLMGRKIYGGLRWTIYK